MSSQAQSSYGPYLSLMGWFLLPNLVTGFLQNLFYKFTIRVGDPVPAPGSPKYQRHRHNIYMAVIALYLVYAIVEAFWNVLSIHSGNPASHPIYDLLGVSPFATEREIKSVFRRLSLTAHPDKGGEEGQWIQIKDAYDVLTNDAARFVYDRFGSAGLRFAAEMKPINPTPVLADLVMWGARNSILMYYGGYAVGLVAVSLLGLFKSGHTWRYYILILCATTEAYIAFRSTHELTSSIPLLRWLGIAPFQFVQILRNLMLTSFVALNQLVPLFQWDEKLHPISTVKGQQQVVKKLETIAALATNIDYESLQTFAHQTLPFREDPKLMAALRTGLVAEMIEKKLETDVYMQDALKNVDLAAVRQSMVAESQASIRRR